MNRRMLLAARKALKRARRAAKYLSPEQRRSIHAMIADVDIALELVESAQARLCTKCNHPERKRTGWCGQWISLQGTDAQLACCDSSCSYAAT